MSKKGHSGRRLRTAVAVFTLAGSFAVGVQPASAATRRVAHCVAPDGVDVPAGTDLNALFGESAQIASNFYGCGTILTGAPWTRVIGFNFSKTWAQVPAGFVPTAATPLQDFVTKLVGFRMTVDVGTPQEFSEEFPNGPRLWTGNLSGFDPSIGDYSQYDWAQGMTLVTMRPLSAGQHTVQTSVIFNGVQCDGLHSDPDLSCLPAGETVIGSSQFTWVAS